MIDQSMQCINNNNNYNNNNNNNNNTFGCTFYKSGCFGILVHICVLFQSFTLLKDKFLGPMNWCFFRKRDHRSPTEADKNSG